MIASFAMKRPCRLMIYGATGFTGTLIARAAVELDCELVLAARDSVRLAAVARPLGLPFRAFSLEEPSAAVEALGDIDFVLNAAGPVIATSEPLIAACLATRTHYLDVTAELSVFVAAHRHDAAARERGIMIMPGAGFLIVASDCLAADIAAITSGAKYLRIGVHPIKDIFARQPEDDFWRNSGSRGRAASREVDPNSDRPFGTAVRLWRRSAHQFRGDVS